LRRNTWPGLALAGGVVIAALIALLLIGSDGPSGGGLPKVTNPGATRLFPSPGEAGDVAGTGGTSPGSDRRRGHRDRDAARSQYDATDDRGAVLGGP
jgi:hypothetical protein